MSDGDTLVLDASRASGGFSFGERSPLDVGDIAFGSGAAVADLQEIALEMTPKTSN
jgi:hypothetical protein